ncbi:MAG: 16S rRNA (cytosine(1402)-N(4))-methyltransferase RsmH [Sphingobacteriia bacterium]|nr:16S rRNA (cytosine(1402)-N(4))-methyltransferase RsmH [Sphingobacteriia bacterium]
MKQLPNPDYHVPVLFTETLDGLNIRPDGVYVDCTFGGGGHSKGILQRLGENGKLIAFDQDVDAKQNVPDDKRILFVPHNFRHLHRFLKLHHIPKVDGLMADLGVSSHQFDEGERGFSIRFDGPLDMRMNVQQALTAENIVTTYSEQQLHLLFEQYGEVSNAKTLARHIVQNRTQMPAQTILQFKALISPVVKGNPNKYLAQVFQALRIEVNDELGALKDLLQQVLETLLPGGRAAIITFHSLEDRMVKNFFRGGEEDDEQENPFLPNKKEKQFRLVNKKPITASQDELKKNPRSRSAKLRIAEKI